MVREGTSRGVARTVGGGAGRGSGGAALRRWPSCHRSRPPSPACWCVGARRGRTRGRRPLALDQVLSTDTAPRFVVRGRVWGGGCAHGKPRGRARSVGASLGLRAPGTQMAGQHASRARRLRPGPPTDGAQEGGALGHRLWRRNAKMCSDAQFWTIPIGGRMRTAQQRAVRT